MKKSIFGILIMMESLFLALTGALAFLFKEDNWYIFMQTSGGALLVGILCKYFGSKEKNARLTRADSFLVVALSWVVFSFIGMIPFIFIDNMDTASAFFETMSGFTTTGATCIKDIDAVPRSLLFWRALTHWIGGLGIVVFSVALIPTYDFKNSNIVSAEVTGLSLDKLRPKIGSTARRLLIIYLLLSLACFLLYWVGPMNLFDAICHAMSTIATGGFSTHTASFGYYQSAYLEYVCVFFMLVSSINFSLYYYLSVGRPRVLWKNEELRAFLFFVTLAVICFVLLFYFAPLSQDEAAKYPVGFEKIFRTSLFHVSSLVSSTGFAAETFDYVTWGTPFWMPTIILMAMGACAGSTGGGIKVIRILIAVKSIFNELVLQLHPRAVLNVRINGRIVPDDQLRRTQTFIFLYITLAIIAMMCYSLLGDDIYTALGSSISMLSNVGPGMGHTGPAGSFADVTPAGKWLMSFYMLVGRLEIFTVLFLFMPNYWKQRK